MFIKKSGCFLALTSFLVLSVLPPASAVGRKVISATSAKTGVKIPVTSQGVAVTIPGEEISFIQLSHLSNITCTTDNGNMCAGSSGSANILYLRRTSIYFQDQLPSPDGSTMLFIKTNGATCSSLCQLQLVPSSSIPAFTVLEIGGVDLLPTPKKAPVSVRPLPPAPSPSPKISISDTAILPTQVKIDLLEPQNQIVSQVLPQKELIPKELPKAISPIIRLSTPIPALSPSPIPTKKLQQAPALPPKALPSPSIRVSPSPLKKRVTYATPATELGSRVIANLLVKGLLVANRTKEIGFNTSLRARVQDLIRNLRKDLPLPVAQKRANVSSSVINRLIQLGGKK